MSMLTELEPYGRGNPQNWTATGVFGFPSSLWRFVLDLVARTTGDDQEELRPSPQWLGTTH